MKDTTTYNGYTNHATWNANLWLSNDEPTYRTVWFAAQDAFRLQGSNAVTALAEWLERSDLTKHLLKHDGINASEVNWNEIAGRWIEDVRESLNNDED